MSDCKNGISDFSWEDIKNKYSLPFHPDTLRKCTVSVFGMPDVLEYYKNKGFNMSGQEYIKELQEEKNELFRLKKQYSDQRREYYKLQTSEARSEHLTDFLKMTAKNLDNFVPLRFSKNTIIPSKKEAVLVLADWHYGMTTDNIWNKYNTETCKQRVEDLINKTKKQIELHKPKKLHVILLGDLAHGAIHTGCRVASEEDVCDEIMNVAEIVAQSINELSNCGSIEKTVVYSTYGNHLRTIQNKNDSIHTDNMEKLISWWLKPRLNRDDIEVIDSEFKEFIKLSICGYNIVCTHGDLDSIKNLGVLVNTIFTKKYGQTIDYTISADKHHLEEFEAFNIENILVRSLCGTEDYANSKRLYSSAGQTLMFFTPDDGRETVCNIKLD